MAAALADSIVDLLRGLPPASADQGANSRVTLEGITFGAGPEGALAVAIRKVEAASLRVASGPFLLEVGRLVLDQVVAQVCIEEGKPRLCAAEAAGAELSGVKLHVPWVAPPQARGDEAWSLAPLATANGSIRAEIVDAHLLFDADVTVPIQQGQVDFNKATVAHVGPDSRMGASRLGIYVDAANGRSYLYQFASAPVAGVEYERRGALPGPWSTDRGRLQLQPFGEWLLRQPGSGQFLGLTEQARLLFDRTAVSGEVRLGDGRFAAPGVQAELAGRSEGRNAVRLHSESVGRGLGADIAALSVRNAAVGAEDTQVICDELTGALELRLGVEGTQLHIALEAADMKVWGLRLRLAGAGRAGVPSNPEHR